MEPRIAGLPGSQVSSTTDQSIKGATGGRPARRYSPWRLPRSLCLVACSPATRRHGQEARAITSAVSDGRRCGAHRGQCAVGRQRTRVTEGKWGWWRFRRGHRCPRMRGSDGLGCGRKRSGRTRAGPVAGLATVRRRAGSDRQAPSSVPSHFSVSTLGRPWVRLAGATEQTSRIAVACNQDVAYGPGWSRSAALPLLAPPAPRYDSPPFRSCIAGRVGWLRTGRWRR